MDDKAKIRRDRLTIKEGPRAYSARYSRVVRSLRLILPLVSVAIIAIVFVWSDMDDERIAPVPQDHSSRRTIGKNELLEPRFESRDDKQQPFTITAARAIQGDSAETEGLLVLDRPVADILLENNSWVAIRADRGAYQEDQQRLLLNGNVAMFHDLGYQFQTAQLHVDLANNHAWSHMEVYGQGPAGNIRAKGVDADGEKNRLVFSGPAKLILNKSIEGL